MYSRWPQIPRIGWKTCQNWKNKTSRQVFLLPTPSLNDVFSHITWNLRSSFQSSVKISPFERHFTRKPSTTWKSLASDKFINISDKGKYILSKVRARNWGSDDKTEDGYVDEPLPKKNNADPTQKGNDSKNQTRTTQDNRVPINNPFSKR